MMDSTWGAGNPCENLPPGAKNLAFDNHRYLTYSPTPPTKAAYLNTSCRDTFPSKTRKGPLIIGEWSLAVKQSVEWTSDFSSLNKKNHEWYRQWWAAQVRAYEKQKGWVFWSWKAEMGADWRWSYKGAVEAGIIPKKFDIDKVKEMAKC